MKGKLDQKGTPWTSAEPNFAERYRPLVFFFTSRMLVLLCLRGLPEARLQRQALVRQGDRNEERRMAFLAYRSQRDFLSFLFDRLYVLGTARILFSFSFRVATIHCYDRNEVELFDLLTEKISFRVERPAFFSFTSKGLVEYPLRRFAPWGT